MFRPVESGRLGRKSPPNVRILSETGCFSLNKTSRGFLMLGLGSHFRARLQAVETMRAMVKTIWWIEVFAVHRNPMANESVSIFAGVQEILGS